MKVHLWQASLAMQCDMLMMSVIVYQVQLDLGYIYWYQTHDDDVTTQKYTQKSKLVKCTDASSKNAYCNATQCVDGECDSIPYTTRSGLFTLISDS